MTSFAISLVLLSAIIHALRDFITKSSEDKQAFLWLFATSGLVLIFPFSLFFLIREGLPSGFGLALMIGTGFVHTLYAFALMKAYEHGDLSHVYPIVRSAPALILIVAILFFDEIVSIKGVAGIILTVCGAYIIGMREWSLKELVEPIRSLSNNPSTRWALVTMCLVATYSVIDKQMVKYGHPMVLQYGYDVIIVLCYTIFITITRRWGAVQKEWNERKVKAALNGVFAFGGYSLILFALRISNVSYVAGLRQLSIVFAILLGNHFLQEKHKDIRLVSGALIFTGALLIAIA